MKPNNHLSFPQYAWMIKRKHIFILLSVTVAIFLLIRWLIPEQGISRDAALCILSGLLCVFLFRRAELLHRKYRRFIRNRYNSLYKPNINEYEPQQ